MTLTTAYFPPIEYFALLAGYSVVYMEAWENYRKQSWRNRCRILSANGPLDLTFPVIHGGSRPHSGKASGTPGGAGTGNRLREPSYPSGRLITEVRVDYSTAWVKKTEKAIESAYSSSPFFEFYRDGLWDILGSKPERLWDLNMAVISYFCEKTGIQVEIRPTSGYSGPDGAVDIHPKRQNSILQGLGLGRPYYQVFGEKFGFVGGLSIMDLLFNEGPGSISYLKADETLYGLKNKGLNEEDLHK